MDATDLAILREMFGDGVLRLGGADPRITASQIARRLDLPVSTVKLRIQGWRRTGFFTGYSVFPNPDIVGQQIYEIVVDPLSASARERVNARVRTFSRVVQVWEPETSHQFYWIGFLDTSSSSALQARSLLSKIPGVRCPEGDAPPGTFEMPVCSITLSNLDWRIVREIRNEPEAPLTRVATKLGVSFRTLARRFDRLIDSHALQYMPRLDFSRTSHIFTLVGIEVAANADTWDIWKRIGGMGREILPFAPWNSPDRSWEHVLRWAETGHLVTYFTTLAAPTDTLAILEEVERWPGVIQGRCSFPAGWWGVPAPYDELVELKIRETRAR